MGNNTYIPPFNNPTEAQCEAVISIGKSGNGAILLSILHERWEFAHRFRQTQLSDAANNVSNGYAQCLDDLILLFQEAPQILAGMKLAKEAEANDWTQTTTTQGIPGGSASAEGRPLG